jgi:hypothetical protein
MKAAAIDVHQASANSAAERRKAEFGLSRWSDALQ